METQEIPMVEEIEQEIGMDTQMHEASTPLDSQRKRIGEKVSGSRKKAKAHRKTLKTSLTANYVELIATTVEDKLSEVWENAKNYRDLILEKIQEVKNVLE
jgi:hypothetical protein